MEKIQAVRYHDISAGHRVHGHESKCAHLHGHNYRVHFTVEKNPSTLGQVLESVFGSPPGVDKPLDELGRVMDFSVIKSKLCNWLEENWDHKFLIWIEDPMFEELIKLDPKGVQAVNFNPTAENMALFLLNNIAPALLHGTGCSLAKVVVEETRKCSAVAERI